MKKKIDKEQKNKNQVWIALSSGTANNIPIPNIKVPKVPRYFMFWFFSSAVQRKGF